MSFAVVEPSPITGASAAPVADAIHRAIQRSWDSVDPLLRDDVTDPRAVIPFVSEQSRSFYWELHFEGQKRTGTDFLHRLPLEPGGALIAGAPDPIAAELFRWFVSGETAAICHASAWLEIDGPLTLQAPPRPQGVSVCLDRDIGSRTSREPARPVPSLPAVIDVFSRLQTACGGGSRSRNGALERIHGAVAGFGGELRHLSVMRGRAEHPAKVYAALPKATLEAFLIEVGWPGDRPAALSLAELVCSESRRVNLDLELRDALTPRIGFELFSDPSPARDPHRLIAIELARALEVISAEQASALKRWDAPPSELFRTDERPDRLHRRLDLKFVLAPGRLELKAYLGFRFHDSRF